MVLLVTGSYPPDVCGVGDYCYHLINAEGAENWELFYRKEWHPGYFWRYLKSIEKLKPEKIIFQYPTQGYGWSMVPFLLMICCSVKMGRKCIVAYHEFTNRSKKAWLVQNLALYFMKNAVVTNEYEKRAVKKWHKRLNVSVIKIYSNIKKSNHIKPFSERSIAYCYFGQIRPEKGIEGFLDFIEKATCSASDSLIMGMIPEQFRAYGNAVVRRADKLGMQVKLNASAAEAADILADSKCLMLLFPDGLSERRGSFMAGAMNGCLIFSTAGRYTSKSLQKCIYKILPDKYENIEEAFAACNNRKWRRYFGAVNEYFDKNLPHSWNEVVQKYNEV